MNANELPADQLADLLDEIPVGDFENLDHHHFTRQAATMLRKLQDELSDLQRHIPTKKVTEGEILNIYLCLTNGNKDLDLFEFAEEILKKAKE